MNDGTGGGELAPRREVGICHDRGDAETGSRIELGAGVSCGDAKLGLGGELWQGNDIDLGRRRSETPVLSVFQSRDPGARGERR